MTIQWKKYINHLSCKGRKIPCSCIVRNELNGWRPNHDSPPRDEVVYSINQDGTQGEPVMPRVFPWGTWEVYRPQKRTSRYLAPFYIPTNAWQDLEIWSLDEDGMYRSPTGATIKDYGYGLHHSKSRTTLGCLKIEREKDLRWLVSWIDRAIDSGESVVLEVT